MADRRNAFAVQQAINNLIASLKSDIEEVISKSFFDVLKISEEYHISGDSICKKMKARFLAEVSSSEIWKMD